MQPITEQA